MCLTIRESLPQILFNILKRLLELQSFVNT
jgi:hypothetical protein